MVRLGTHVTGRSEMQIQFTFADRPEWWREGPGPGMEAGAGRVDSPRPVAGVLFLQGWETSRVGGTSRPQQVWQAPGVCGHHTENLGSRPSRGWCPSPCPLPSPPDITWREEVWKHVDVSAGFLPRCAHKVYVPGGPHVFIESLLYDSAWHRPGTKYTWYRSMFTE